jgi:hypothetical protein
MDDVADGTRRPGAHIDAHPGLEPCCAENISSHDITDVREIARRTYIPHFNGCGHLACFDQRNLSGYRCDDKSLGLTGADMVEWAHTYHLQICHLPVCECELLLEDLGPAVHPRRLHWCILVGREQRTRNKAILSVRAHDKDTSTRALRESRLEESVGSAHIGPKHLGCRRRRSGGGQMKDVCRLPLAQYPPNAFKVSYIDANFAVPFEAG